MAKSATFIRPRARPAWTVQSNAPSSSSRQKKTGGSVLFAPQHPSASSSSSSFVPAASGAALGAAINGRNNSDTTNPTVQWKRLIQTTKRKATYIMSSRSRMLLFVLPLLATIQAVYSVVRFQRRRRKQNNNNAQQGFSIADDFPDYPTPPKTFEPLPIDNVGMPNVVYGCGNTSNDGNEEDETKQQQQRQVDEIQLHVMGWRRHESLKTLLNQLENADYSNWHMDVPLYIHVDGGSSKNEETVKVVSGFKWTHGPQYVDIQQENLGLRTMWLDSLGPAARNAGDNSLLVVFEDDVRVSDQYFQWLLKTIDAYARNPKCRDSNLVGFSLSPICVQEMRKPFKTWDAREALGRRYNNDYRHLAYLTVVPSSWGAAYWSDQWNEFDKFVRLRMQPPFYDTEAENVLQHVTDYGELKLTPEKLHIPGARSNVWPKSWKRFMVDFMYARGLVMLYPNLPGQKGFATALQESGEHVSTKATSRLLKNPRVVELQEHLNLPVLGNLPRYGDLAVFGLTLLPTTRERLAADGNRFLNQVREQCADCEELVRLWARPGSQVISTLNDNGLVENSNNYYSNNNVAPRTCAADLYTSVSSAAVRPTKPTSTTGERYLLVEPQYGANNQLHAVIEAYYWARALGRRLILPPLFMPRVSAFDPSSSDAAWSEMEDFFHVSDADKPDLFPPNKVVFDGPALKPISFSEFSRTVEAKPWRLLRATRDAIFDDSARVLTKALGADNIELINLRHLFEKPVSVQRVQSLLGGCDDEVLAIDGLYFANLVGVNPRALMPDVMSLSQEAEQLYQAVKKKLVDEIGTTDYNCYHVRLGDFVSMCDTLENADASSGINANYLKTVREFTCTVTPGELSLALQENGSPAFVMSDNPQELRDTLAELPLKTVTSEWVVQAVRKSLHREVSSNDMQLFTLIVDQELCSDAKFAMLNRFSTVSQRVISLRRGEDYEYWKREDMLGVV